MVEEVAAVAVERLKKLLWSKIFHMFYIEPVVFTLVFAHSLSGTILKNQVIYQACSTVFQYNESDCQQLGTKSVSGYINDIETEVQPYVAHLFMVRTLLESIVPAICGIFIGSWSDHYGRKPLLLVSMIGFSFTYVITAVICQISSVYPVNPWFYIIAAVPHSVLGGNCVFSVAAFCFISDITDTKSRPYRMIFMEAFFFIGLMTGSLISSFVYAATNATITFIISAVLMCGATIFIALCVPESLHYKCHAEDKLRTELELQVEVIEVKNGTEVDNTANSKQKNENDNPKKDGDSKGTDVNENSRSTATEKEKSKAAGLFSYVHIKDMLATCLKERPYYDRCIIWLITGVMFLSIFVFDGVITVMYLFVREKFHWSVRDFTLFESVSHLVPMLGAIVGVLVLRKFLSMSVVALAILALFSHMISSIVRGVASEPWHLYLSIAVGAFSAVGSPMCRTIVSNIVPSTDLGKIFSIKNVLQSIAPFIAAPMYTFIYERSLRVFPGLFNIVSAFLYLLAVICLIIVLYFKHAHKEHYGKVLK